jgi:drug/metabolite transporter (DMT)-like permease
MWLLWTLAACICFGSSAAIQKHAIAARLPALSFRTLAREWRRVLRELLTSWVWLLGLAVEIPATVFMILAVADGEISVIQPLVNANVLVAMLAGVVFLRERLSALEWTGAGVLLSGAGVVTAAAIASPGGPAAAPDVPAVGWVSLAFCLPALGLTLLSRRLRARPEPVLAVAAGLWFGLSTVWLKVLTVRLEAETGPFLDSAVAVALDWPLWAIVAANVLGFVQFQMAFSHGRVAVVSPLTTIAAVIPPVVGGMAALGEPATPARIAGIAVIAVGTALLFARPRG